MDKIIFMQSTNFEFLRDGNETLANLGGLAEAVLHIDAGSALTRLRSFAEEVTKSIYEAEGLPRVPQASFYEMTKDSVFRHCVDSSLIHHIGYLRVKGNEAAHGAEGDKRNAIQALETAYQIAMYMGLKYYGKRKTDIVAFQPIKDLSAELKELKQTVSQYQMTLEAKAEEVDKLIDALDAERAKAAENIAVPTGEVQLAKQQASQSTAQSLQWDEAKTRALLIDALLQQAGWGVTDSNQVSVEFELQFADNSSGKGYADYVLWGDNGQPLAVVEAKRSSQKNLQAGREQARLYADALEKMGYDRPVVFYTNGYETFIWDDQQYNTYRPIYGFYSKDSLEYLIYQRQFRQADLEQFNPDVAIAGRPYQIEAIKTIAHHFQQQRRKGLIVQATGTGKTRVAIAISELLLRTGWGKRVLFLCDRKELRAQADDAFKEFLPSEPRCVIGETNQIDQNVRIYVSTYPGMMNRFAQLDVGFFDLIVADESHRTIYNKYRDLFDYFDALQLGLTATPVKYISRNTFDIFDCESTDPTFEFGLDAAINNEPPYLVPFKVKDLTTEFLRDGIHYNDLDDDQKKRLEEDLGEEVAKQTTIKGKDIGRKIFSESTDRIILENLMNNGIKDETNSLVGKTIIFAQRQDHAEHLEKLFCKLYPQHGVKVCKVIHNAIPKVESLIKEFKKPGGDFRIAISVDMLDTGIDVPEVVNLVFAKPVRSWVKFWQMIGRGTRLCENLFGPGKDKEQFLIFDHYSNFTYFDEEYQEAEEIGAKSLLQTSFETRLDLVDTALKCEVPVGLVSQSYTLAQHLDVAQYCLDGFEASGINPSTLRCELGLSELSEWMNFRVYFPKEYDFMPADGHGLNLRLECFNSVDGNSRLEILLGWYRLVCSNGMVIGETVEELRDIHNKSMDLSRISKMVVNAMQKVKLELLRLQRWESIDIEEEAFVNWINKTLAKKWGKVAACRAYHICTSGYDVEIVDIFKAGKPTEKIVKELDEVPGWSWETMNLYDVGQSLSWIATQRPNAEKRTEQQLQIPELLESLAAAIPK